MILHKRWRAGVACWGTSSGSRVAGPGEHCLTQSAPAARSPPWAGAGAAIWRAHLFGARKCHPAASGVGSGRMFLLVTRPLGVEAAIGVDAVVGVGAEVVA